MTNQTSTITLTGSATQGGSTHVGPAAVERFQVITVKRALMMAKSGMLLTRGATPTKMRAMVTKWTGVTYKGADKNEQAIADCVLIIEALERGITFKDLRHENDNRG